jgi:hypothetical protein
VLIPRQATPLLAIYLNDHLAGATLGVELARRSRAANEDDPELGPALASLCAEIEQDRATLELLMDRLEISRSRVKPAGAWVSERLGRLKLNGRWTGYSPLSRLIELEGLHLGITGKLRMWEVVGETVGDRAGAIDFGQLAERAAAQRDRVGEMHRAAAARAFPPSC